jgi:putative transposase
MKQSKFSETQIVNILKEAEAGIPVGELSRKHGFSKVTLKYLYTKFLCSTPKLY